jgi:hypothetical protein
MGTDREAYASLEVCEPPPLALNRPQPAFAAIALAISLVYVSFELAEREALQETCVSVSIAINGLRIGRQDPCPFFSLLRYRFSNEIWSHRLALPFGI